jgi:hypothetical protein
MGTTNILDMNNRISALKKDVTSVEDAVDEISENVIKQTAGTSITLNGQHILYHDSVQYNGFAMFPFMTKNTDYTVSINAASQDNVGDVRSSITIGQKSLMGFRFKITGAYDYKKCGIGLNYTITFA